MNNATTIIIRNYSANTTREETAHTKEEMAEILADIDTDCEAVVDTYPASE